MKTDYITIVEVGNTFQLQITLDYNFRNRKENTTEMSYLRKKLNVCVNHYCGFYQHCDKPSKTVKMHFHYN